jgi:dolichyl-phosphate beta-glucosyltransferase
MNEIKNSAEELAAWMRDKGAASPTPALSLVIPAYNEYWRLPSTLMEAIDYLDAQVQERKLRSYEIIVVDDGSKDATAQLVGKFEKICKQVSLIRLPRNYGKGHAVRVGMLNAHGERVLFADADGSSPIDEMKRLSAALDAGFDVAFASRALNTPDTKVTTTWLRKYPGRLFNFLVNLLVLPGVADSQCGFKMFTARAARFLFERQQCDGWAFDVEILFIAHLAGLKAKEVPISWTNVPGSKVNLATDSLRMLKDLVVFHFRHRHITPSDYEAHATTTNG